MKMQNLRRLPRIFLINLLISSFTFGGGYVVIPMIRKYFVHKNHYITEEDVMDMAAIAQSSPGAIAVNLAVLAGYKTAGAAGAVVSCIASVLPALIILSLVSHWYDAVFTNSSVAAVLKGMEAGVAALIVSLVLDMYRGILKENSRLLTLLVPLVFAGNYFFNINVALLLAGSALACLLPIFYQRRKEIRK